MRLKDAESGAQTAAQLVHSTRLGAHTVARALADLVHGGLARHDTASDGFSYAPRNARDRAALEDVATLYHQRPVTLVKLVYEQPASAVKSFADAFRLRDDREEK